MNYSGVDTYVNGSAKVKLTTAAQKILILEDAISILAAERDHAQQRNARLRVELLEEQIEKLQQELQKLNPQPQR